MAMPTRLNNLISGRVADMLDVREDRVWVQEGT